MLVIVIWVRIDFWGSDRHPIAMKPEEPSVCPECGEVAFIGMRFGIWHGKDHEGNHAYGMEAFGECNACNTKFFSEDDQLWRIAEASEWDEYLKTQSEIAFKSNTYASYYSGDTDPVSRR